MKTLTFNGKSSSEFGIVIQEPPVYDFPEKDYEIQHVPGRSGDIVVNLGSYKNTQRTYNLVNAFVKDASALYPWNTGITPLANDFVTRAHAMVRWLMEPNGYAILEDDYEPEIYRKAMYYAGGSFTNIYDQATAIQATFECKPQRYLKDGLNEVQIYPAGIINIPNTNPEYNTLPKMTFWFANSLMKNFTIMFVDEPESDVCYFGIKISVPDTHSSLTKVTIDWENKLVYNTYNPSDILNKYVTLRIGSALDSTTLDDFKEIFKNRNNVVAKVYDNAQYEYIGGIDEVDVIFNWWYII